MNKLTKIIIGIIVLVVVIGGLVWWLNATGPVEQDGEAAALLSYFTYDGEQRQFVATGRGLSTVVVEGVPVGEEEASNLILGEMTPAGTEDGLEVWTLPVPKYPVQITAIIAVGYDEAGEEVGRLTLALSGATEIYNTLWLQVPFEEAVLSVGESFTVDDFTLKLIDIAEDSRCPAGVECIQAGRVTADLEVTVDGKTSSISLRSDEGERKIGTKYITMVKIEPTAEEGKKLSATDYEITFYITEDISKL